MMELYLHTTCVVKGTNKSGILLEIATSKEPEIQASINRKQRNGTVSDQARLREHEV